MLKAERCQIPTEPSLPIRPFKLGPCGQVLRVTLVRVLVQMVKAFPILQHRDPAPICIALDWQERQITPREGSRAHETYLVQPGYAGSVYVTIQQNFAMQRPKDGLRSSSAIIGGVAATTGTYRPTANSPLMRIPIRNTTKGVSICAV